MSRCSFDRVFGAGLVATHVHAWHVVDVDAICCTMATSQAVAGWLAGMLSLL